MIGVGPTWFGGRFFCNNPLVSKNSRTLTVIIVNVEGYICDVKYHIVLSTHNVQFEILVFLKCQIVDDADAKTNLVAIHTVSREDDRSIDINVIKSTCKKTQ